jgi:Fe-Mn family superoxide dismutase
MAFELPPLPYPKNALAPHMSEQTLEFHHGKHHQAYYTNLNNLVKDSPLASLTLEEIIVETAKDPAKAGIFNNAAQAWNHNLFWPMMKPNGGGAPTGKIVDALTQSFGSVDKFKEEFKAAAVSQFGSGWAWLSLEGGTLKVTKTANGVNPLVTGGHTLLGIDVWEHAYYLDYQNRRPDYVQTFLDKLVNWDYVTELLTKAGG